VFRLKCSTVLAGIKMSELLSATLGPKLITAGLVTATLTLRAGSAVVSQLGPLRLVEMLYVPVEAVKLYNTVPPTGFDNMFFPLWRACVVPALSYLP